jgi:type II secretory pathway component PulF
LTGPLREEWYRAMSDALARDTPLFALLSKHEEDFARSGDPRLPLVRELRMRTKGFGEGGASKGPRNFGTDMQGLVPETEAMLIQAGVASGRTPEGLKRAADLLGTQGRLWKSVLLAMAQPALLIVALLVLLVYVSLAVLPKVMKGKSTAGLPLFAAIYAWIADHILWVAGSCSLLLIAACTTVIYLAPRWVGPARAFADRSVFPFTMIASINGASFLTSLGGFIASGIPIKAAITSVRACANPYMRWQCDLIRSNLDTGDRAEVALAKSTLLHVRYHWLVATYGMSGDATEAYERIAAALTQAIERFVQRLFSGVVNPILKIMVVMFVIWTLSAIVVMSLNDGKSKSSLFGTAAPGEGLFVRAASVHSSEVS